MRPVGVIVDVEKSRESPSRSVFGTSTVQGVFIRLDFDTTGLEHDGWREISGKKTGINFNRPYHTGTNSHHAIIMTGSTFAPAFPTVHPLAMLIETIRNKYRLSADNMRFAGAKNSSLTLQMAPPSSGSARLLRCLTESGGSRFFQTLRISMILKRAIWQVCCSAVCIHLFRHYSDAYEIHPESPAVPAFDSNDKGKAKFFTVGGIQTSEFCQFLCRALVEPCTALFVGRVRCQFIRIGQGTGQLRVCPQGR